METTEYVLLDSSQLIRLCEENEIGLLSSPDFIRNYGLPLMTMHNLIELAGTVNFPVFRKRVAMLSTVESLCTLNYDGKQYPGSVSDLATFEIDAAMKYGTENFDKIRDHIISCVQPFKLQLSDAETKYIYEASKEHRARTSFLSTFNNPLLNPLYDVRIADLEGLCLNYKDSSGVDSFITRFKDIIKSRGISDAKAAEAADTFVRHLYRAQEEIPNGSNVVDIIGTLAGERVNPKRTLEYYMQRYLFNMQLQNVAKVMGIQPSLLSHYRMEELRVLNLSILLKHELEISIANDTRRPIETSSVDDLYLALHSLVLDVFADKRTIDLVRRVNRELKYELRIRPVTYGLQH